MAITIQAQPTSSIYYSAGNPVEYLVSSTNTALSNFKIIAKVYETTTTSTLLATLYLDVIPNTSQVLFDAQRVLRSTLSELNITNLRTGVSDIKNETTRFHSCVVTFQEYYGSVPVASGATSSGSTFNYYNGQLKYSEWVRGDNSKLTLNSTTTSNTYNQRLLTAWDNYAEVSPGTVVANPAIYFRGAYHVRKLRTSQLAQLMWMYNGTSGTYNSVTMHVFTSDLLTYASKTLSVASSSNVRSLNVGYVAASGLSWGGGNFDNLGVRYMTLYVKNNNYDLSASYLFEYDHTACSRFDSYEIHWLNRYGGWDSWVFDKRGTHTTEIERRSYNQTTLPISGTNIVHNSYDINNKNFAVLTKERYRVNSGYLKAWELEGLEHLLTSPNVYWNSADGFINIAIENPEKHEHKTNTVDKLFTLTFEFVIDNNDVRL